MPNKTATSPGNLPGPSRGFPYLAVLSAPASGSIWRRFGIRWHNSAWNPDTLWAVCGRTSRRIVRITPPSQSGITVPDPANSETRPNTFFLGVWQPHAAPQGGSPAAAAPARPPWETATPHWLGPPASTVKYVRSSSQNYVILLPSGCPLRSVGPPTCESARVWTGSGGFGFRSCSLLRRR